MSSRLWISLWRLCAVVQNDDDDCAGVRVEPADATWYVTSVIAETSAAATTIRNRCKSLPCLSRRFEPYCRRVVQPSADGTQKRC